MSDDEKRDGILSSGAGRVPVWPCVSFVRAQVREADPDLDEMGQGFHVMAIMLAGAAACAVAICDVTRGRVGHRDQFLRFCASLYDRARARSDAAGGSGGGPLQ